MNIVYIMSDDHAQQMISAYDNRYGNTPNIDRLANEGVLFTNSFVANSLSGPSRACLLTGKHSHANGFATNEDHFDGNQQTVQKLLHAAGYQTAMIGKWHLESEPVGFDYWEILPGQGDYYQPDFITQEGQHREKGYVTDLITDKAIKWMGERDRQKPFCLFVHHKATHRNWMAKLKDLYAYEDKEFPLPDNFFDNFEGKEAAKSAEMRISDHMTYRYDLKVQDIDNRSHYLDRWYNDGDTLGTYGRMLPEEKLIWNHFYDSISQDLHQRKLPEKELAVWKYQRYIKDYLKSAKALDDNIGRLYDYLKENNLLENTLIIYTSDQGFYMGEHGWFDKRFMYEESMRTPLVIRLPERFGIRNTKITELVQNIDHAPCFLDIAGASIPQDIQGVSYLPLLKGLHPDAWRKALYYHYQEYPAEHAVKRHYGIRTERYKLMHFYYDINTWEMYDLMNDPMEIYNLIDAPESQQVKDSLKRELYNLQVTYNDSIRFKYPIE
ncbi:MAG: sulfatase [Pigmentiphaga sp.]|nr:sulfatase [Pigmentiphaga sp.]